MSLYLSANDVYLVEKDQQVVAIRMGKNRIRELIENQLLDLADIRSIHQIVLLSENTRETVVPIDVKRTVQGAAETNILQRVNYHFFLDRTKPIREEIIYPSRRISNLETLRNKREQAEKTGCSPWQRSEDVC